MAYSTNGIDFHRPPNPNDGLLIDRASVPDGVVLPNGRLLVYFIDGCEPYNGVAPRSGVAVAISDQQGAPGSWVFKNVQFVGVPPEYSSAEHGSQNVDPNVVLLPDGSLSLMVTVFWEEGGSIQSGPLAFTSTDGGLTYSYQGLRYAGIVDPENYRFSDTNWQIITGELPGVKGWAMSTDGGVTFQPFGSFPSVGVVHEIAAGESPGEYRAYVTTPTGITSFTSTADPWTTWTEEPGYRLELDTTTGLESCEVRFPTVLRLGPGRYLMIYETVIPGCGCEGNPVCS